MNQVMIIISNNGTNPFQGQDLYYKWVSLLANCGSKRSGWDAHGATMLGMERDN